MVATLGMKSSFQSVQICSTAAMVRAAMETAQAFHAMKYPLDNAVHDTDNVLYALGNGNVWNFGTPAIVESMQHAIDCAFIPDLRGPQWRIFLEDVTGPPGMQREITWFLASASTEAVAEVEVVRQRRSDSMVALLWGVRCEFVCFRMARSTSVRCSS